jgi:UDP-glucuronate decarboxylase
MTDNKQHKTILIAGGAGFIGSHLIEKYLNEGHRVICLDNLQTTWKPKNIERFLKHPRFQFIRQDIIEPINIKEKIDWIFNCACSGSYTSYQFNPVHTVKTNTVGMINLLELARLHKARILQTSTSEIYGDPLETPQKESYRGNVNSLGPRACYDEGKRVAETLCMDYHREFAVDVRIVRIFNTYGPNMDPNDGRAITNFVMNALIGRDLVIYGDGTQTRSFQYIDDLVAGLDAMMRKDGFLGPVNLGNPGEVTMKELAEQVMKMTGSSSRIIFAEGATDDPKRRCPDNTLAKRELNWEPKIALADGLKKTIAYFMQAQWPEKKVLVFATTYYPDMGPAERALFELSKQMPDTEFHIVTTKFRKGVPEIEEVGTDTVHRIGIGHRIDKFLLPILGFIKAKRLAKEHNYRFVWSVMGSYSGMTALLFKLMNRESNLLLSLDDKEIDRKGIKMRFLTPIYRLLLGKTDSVYVSNIALAEGSELLKDAVHVNAHEGDTKSFVNKVRYSYADLVNKQESKLHRPK